MLSEELFPVVDGVGEGLQNADVAVFPFTIVLSPNEVLNVFMQRGRLIDPVTGLVRSIETVSGIAFASIVRLSSRTCKIPIRSYALSSNLLHLPALLSVGKVSSGGWSTYTDYAI